MTDATSLTLAQAFERLAQFPVDISAARLSVRWREADVEEGAPPDRLERARKHLADLEAEKERAVLELAAQLEVWRRVP
jgi:hypothetical protein